MEMALKVLPDTATITLGFDGEQELHLPNEPKARTTVRALPDSQGEWIPATDGPYDLVLADYSGHQPSSALEALIPLVQSGGWLFGFSQQLSTVPSGSLQLGEHFAFFRTETYTNGTALENDGATILSLQGSQSLKEAVSTSSLNKLVREKLIKDFSPERDLRVVIEDTTGTIFSAMSSDAGVFEAVKTVLISGVRALWLTQGVKQGRSASAGMAEGFLRTIGSEQTAAQILLLDIDYGETARRRG